jgi:hypothetical protein
VGFLLPNLVGPDESDFFCVLIVKGVAKIARKLGFDYAEAVVRAFFYNLVRLGVTSDFENALPKSNLITYTDWI